MRPTQAAGSAGGRAQSTVDVLMAGAAAGRHEDSGRRVERPVEDRAAARNTIDAVTRERAVAA